MINRIFNWTAGSFFRTLGRFVFYGLITAIIVFLFSIFNAKALEYDNINSNINVNSSWNNFNFNSNNYISANAQGWFNEVSIKYSLTFDVDSNVCPSYNANYDQFEYFVLDLCSTSDILGGGNFYNDNGFTDLIYKTNSSCSVGGYQGKVFKLFVRMNTNFSCNTGTSSNNFVTLTNKNNNIYLFNSSNYNVPLRFTNIYYYDNSTYDSLLNDYSNMNSQQETNNKLDGIQSEQNQTNQELGEMNDYIQDDTPASTDDIDMDSLGTVSGLLPEGPVDSLLNIPFTFLSVLTSSMGGVCVPITGTFVFDSTLSIPCFDSFYDEVPDYLMNFINLIPAGFILIMYFKHLYKKVERAVSLQTTTDDEWGVI